VKSGAFSRSEVVVVSPGAVEVVFPPPAEVEIVSSKDGLVVAESPVVDGAGSAAPPHAAAPKTRRAARTYFIGKTVGLPLFIADKSQSTSFTRRWQSHRYNQNPVSDTNLFFCYTSLLAPERISEVAPQVEFQFSAHFPGTRLVFVLDNGQTIPTLVASEDHTVWGAVFSVPFEEMEAITHAEKEDGRRPGWEMRAIDREGNKHECTTFVGPEGRDEVRPDREQVAKLIAGARHWKLPAGWIVGLEDLLDDQLLF
jgi:hypothetical protein